MADCKINDQGGIRRYFTQIPNLVDDMDLTPHAFRLYVHLKRVAGDDGTCWQSTSTLAEACKMSRGAISNAKKELAEAGLITIKEIKDEHMVGKPYHSITIVDLWAKNEKSFYPQPSQEKIQSSPDERQSSYSEQQSSPHELYCSPGEQQSSPGELKNNPIKNNPLRIDRGKSKRARNPRIDHPAIKMIRGVTGKYPPTPIFDDVIREFGDSPDGVKFANVHREWVKRGFNAMNLAGQIDWYKHGIPQNGNGKKSSYSEKRTLTAKEEGYTPA